MKRKKKLKKRRTKKRWGYEYSIISGVYYCDDLGEYRSYGVSLTGNGHKQVLHDISCREDEVVRMANMFNEYRLAPVHFKDAVEDMLS